MKLEAKRWGEIVDTVGICGLFPHDAARGHGVYIQYCSTTGKLATYCLGLTTCP